jgi:VIT1/CCC1 family predicted Fe2+/Mn2+ transporter
MDETSGPASAAEGAESARPLKQWVAEIASPRQWAIDANDGIIATAGLLEGFAGAGAQDPVLITAAAAMMIAGSLGLSGAKWAEEASEREAQLALIAEEQAQLNANPDDEIAELAAYWEAKGLEPEVARDVAEQLSAKDALAAQLEYEHGITEPTPRWKPVWIALTSGLAFLLGAAIPLSITILVPVKMEVWAILGAVVISLVATSWIAAKSGRMSVRGTLIRTLSVGIGTLLVSYICGLLLF